MRKRHVIALAASSLLLWGGIASASTINTNTTAGTTWYVDNIASWQTTGNTMGGMTVTAYFSDGNHESLTWVNGIGAVSSNGWSLTASPMDQSTYFSNWILNNSTTYGMTSIAIDGQSVNPSDVGTVFDIVWDPEVTPGSEYGQIITSTDSLSLTVDAEYSNLVALNGASPLGDLYQTLTLTFSGTGYSGTGFSFMADTDNVNAPVPEPATMVLLGAGLAGLAGIRRTRQQ